MRASVHFVTLPGDPLITDLASLSALLLRLRAGLGVLVLGFLGFFVGFSASTMILHYLYEREGSWDDYDTMFTAFQGAFCKSMHGSEL